MFEEKLSIQDHVTLLEGQSFKQLGTSWTQRRGEDTDYELHAVVDEAGNELKRYLLKAATSMYPPCRTFVTVEEVDQAYTLPTRSNHVGVT